MIYEYKLTFIDPSGASHCYLVSVWTKPWENFYEVKSYKDIDCSEQLVLQKNLMAGGYN